MTGLDRLRGYARRMDELHVWPGGAKLLDIADQIERERNVCDREEHEAASWVREHGGLDAVRSEWSSRVPYDKHEQRRQRLLGHIAECETALGRRNQRIKELGRRVSDLTRENAELRKRTMPEGCEWPRYEDEAPVRIGHDGVRVVELFEDEYRLWGDGEPVSEEPIATGLYGERVVLSAKPEIDSWERIEGDARLKPFGYVDRVLGWDMSKSHSQNQARSAMTHDIVRRCRALAERGE